MESVQVALAEIRSDIKHIREKVDELSESFDAIKEWRDGKAQEPGVNTRLDRLERFQAVILWIAGAAFVSGIGAAATVAVYYMTGG